MKRTTQATALVLLLTIILSYLTFSADAVGTNCPHQATGLLKWSDAATWTSQGQTTPTEGSTVIIKNGTNVLLDVENPPRLVGIEIESGASLVWDLKPIQLHVAHILIKGKLIIGSDECRFDQKTVITLEDEKETPLAGVGQKVIGVLEGGELHMFGKVYAPVWTRIAMTAIKGSKTLHLIEPVEWQAGDTIVIAPTGYDPNEAEEHVIEQIGSDRKSITLKTALAYDHFAISPEQNDDFEERAEIGVLNRFIRIEGNEASEKNGFGGHTMVIDKFKVAHFVGVEFTRCGQRGVLARYPVHYHVVGKGIGSVVKDNSIHYNYQRCITLHSVDYLNVTNNLCYDVEGHGVFIEDGKDNGATMTNNLVIKVKPGILQPHDVYASSGFFITNPNNTITNNQVSGAIGNGFWFAMPVELIGPSHSIYSPTNPSRAVLGVFENNKVRTVKQNGLFVDLGIDMGNRPVVPGYDPRQDPLVNDSPPVAASFVNFQATKVKEVGIHTRGGYHVISNAKIGGAFAGVRFANTPGAPARQSMQGGLITRLTKNAPSETEPQKGTKYAGMPVRGIIPYGGPNSIKGVTVTGFTMPNGACVAPLGYEQMAPSNILQDVKCDNGQTLFYTSASGSDNEKMFVGLQISGTTTKEWAANNAFMKLVSPQCEKLSDSLLSCKSHSYAPITIEDLDYHNTTYPSSLNQADVHATIYRLDANKKTATAQVDIVGYSDPILNLNKKTMYPFVVPQDSDSQYGVIFQHQTPRKLRIGIDYVPSGTRAMMNLCYNPSGSSIKSVQADGKALTQASSEQDLQNKLGTSYFYDSSTGRLSIPIIANYGDSATPTKSAPTYYTIEATVTATNKFVCFDTQTPQPRDSSHSGSSTSTSTLFTTLVVVSVAIIVFVYGSRATH